MRGRSSATALFITIAALSVGGTWSAHLRRGHDGANDEDDGSAALILNLPQVEAEGYFDIIERPEQFYELVNMQIAPNTKGKYDGKSAAHVQRLIKSAASDDDVVDGDDAADDGVTNTNADADAAAQARKQRRRTQKRLPAFLFNPNDFAKIQSNAKNIANDTGNNFFYERNIIVEPQLPADKRMKSTSKRDNSYGVPKEKLHRMLSFRRRLFKQLKGKRLGGGKKHTKRRADSTTAQTKSRPQRKHKRSRQRKNQQNQPHPRRHEQKQKVKHNTRTMQKTMAHDLTLSRNWTDDYWMPPSVLPMQQKRDRRAVTARSERIWEFGVVPYEIDHKFGGSHKALFKQAMRHWENYTCIKFVERDPKVHRDYIYFTVTACGCCSHVGRVNIGRQDISIGRNCDSFGIVVHELGHVVGFWHEHTRTDRDQHIIINKANIMKGQEYNFDVLTPEDVDSLGLPYNYNSIMHYARNSFSKNTYLETITPIGLAKDERVEMGQRLRLSKGDIEQANLLYKCPMCGQTFQQDTGHIDAPHYAYSVVGMSSSSNLQDVGSGDGTDDDTPNPFDKSLENCEWRITATNGERIILQVHQLHLLDTPDCSTDYLEVRDGYWHRSPVIKRLCGNTTAQTIRSDSSRMLISYVNKNAWRGYRGFTADFEIMCGGDIFLTEERRIDSPNYPLEYMPDKECIWRVTVPDNLQVSLKFQSFELENHDNCIYDYVEIRDGGELDSELIGIFCGYKLPPNIKTNSNQMYIKFVSDGSVQKTGFSALFMQEIDECKFANHGCEHECINTLGSYQCGCFAGYDLLGNGKSCEDSCGGIIDASQPNGVLTSPSYPDVYPIAKECVWEIVAPANFAVFLNFSHFDLEGTKFQYTECDYDYIVAYSKLKDSRLKKIGVFCGHDIPPVLNSEQNILRLEFFSDKSVQLSGFSAQIQIDNNECNNNNGGCQHYCRNTFGSYVCSCRNGYTLDENHHNCTETKCKFEITNSYGVITSPNYPEDYPRNVYCFWHFHTSLGHRVQLIFHDFNMETHQECIYDYIAIHDGRSENSSTLGMYCGGREPYSILASSNEMYMVLRTDAGLQRKGFMATYTTECGGYLRATNHSQVFYSHPRYGSRPYKRNMYCNWRIQSDPESSIKIKFLHFEIEYSDRCDYDSLEITEEASFMYHTNHGRYCGNKKPPSIISYSDTLLLRFQSDESTSLSGFVISFVAVEPLDEDIIDDKDAVTPFPGYMKSIYYASDYD